MPKHQPTKSTAKKSPQANWQGSNRTSRTSTTPARQSDVTRQPTATRQTTSARSTSQATTRQSEITKQPASTRQAPSSRQTTPARQTTTTRQATTTAVKERRINKTLDDLLHDGLKDILDAEHQLIAVLPEVARACNSEDLQEAIEQHLQQTQRHVERIEKVMQRLGISSSQKEVCEAMQGLITETREIIDRYEMSPVRDAALIIAIQKAEHYEIASYGSLCELCDVLGYPKMSDLLGRTLDEEENADRELSEIAQDINDEAHEISLHEEEMYGE